MSAVDLAPPRSAALAPWRSRGPWRHETVVLGFWLIELLVFSVIGQNFASVTNVFEVARISTEVALLALALTPVMVSGGIDLSVGSLMGLCAVLFGLLWHDAGLPLGVCGALTLLAGAAGGALNAVLIARLNIPPLIVTLGTYSLFRGLAKGVTSGVVTYTGFPDDFLFLGQGYLLGLVPVQLPIVLLLGAGFWVLLHRTTFGRAVQAIGFSSAGARFAGVPVGRRLTAIYVLASLVAALAAILYVARLGQAKADAGSSYELMAITAVVLGGTSIFGGRGTVHGTLLGVLAIATLQNGLRLADLPVELAGILAGVLLVASMALGRLLARRQAR